MARLKFAVVNGPGKWDLMLALFERKSVVLRLEGQKGRLELVCRGDEGRCFKVGHLTRGDMAIYVDVLQRCDVMYEDRWAISGRGKWNGRWVYCELDLQTRKGWIVFAELPQHVTAMITLPYRAVA